MRVNGRVARLGDAADPARDRIELDGRPLRSEAHAYWIVHKPRGVVTTRSDPQGRPTVLDLLPPPARRLRLFPVGRLDLDSEGLVLLTNDGGLAQRLLHPSFGSEKEYAVTVRGVPTEAALRRLASGLRLEGGGRPTAPARVSRARSGRERGEAQLRVVLREGRKRQIRRSLAQLGHPVVRLVRVRIGPLRLRALPTRAARALTAAERGALLAHAARLLAEAQVRPQGGVPAGESEAARNPATRSRSHRRPG